KIPTIHEGNVARKMEKRGGNSDRVEINRSIKKINSIENNIMILLDKIKKIKMQRKLLRKLRERAIKAMLKLIRDKKKQYQLFKQKLDNWEENLNEQFNQQSKRNDERERKTSSEDTTIESSKRDIKRRKRQKKN